MRPADGSRPSLCGAGGRRNGRALAVLSRPWILGRPSASLVRGCAALFWRPCCVGSCGLRAPVALVSSHAHKCGGAEGVVDPSLPSHPALAVPRHGQYNTIRLPAHTPACHTIPPAHMPVWGRGRYHRKAVVKRFLLETLWRLPHRAVEGSSPCGGAHTAVLTPSFVPAMRSWSASEEAGEEGRQVKRQGTRPKKKARGDLEEAHEERHERSEA